jgi:ribonuclease P protein component
LTASFSKASRLLKKSDFQRVYRQGIKLFGNALLLYATPTPPQTASRLGISVPKRYGKSHDRNFFKRHIRESFRHLAKTMGSYDLHVLPAKPIDSSVKSALQEEFAGLIAKLSDSK